MNRRYIFWRAIILAVVGIVASGCIPELVVSGLRPEHPEAKSFFYTIYKVGSLQPTFRWQAFPRQRDRKADKTGLLSRVSNVTYDLKIFRAEKDFPAEVVYERQGLTEPLHRVEHPLEPSTKYFWTVRARFQLDGQHRVTQWGVVYENTRFGGWSYLSVLEEMTTLVYIPNPYYYQFETPAR